MSDAIDSLGLSCPGDSKFYICSSKPTPFLGCCASDPCKTTTGDCPPSDLRQASFDAAAVSKIEPQECISTDAEVEWYTCTGTKLPFLGCCGQNPCSTGVCPVISLRGARLSSDEEKAGRFMSGGARMSALPLPLGTGTTTGVESATGSATVSATSSVTTSSTDPITTSITPKSLSRTTSTSTSTSTPKPTPKSTSTNPAATTSTSPTSTSPAKDLSPPLSKAAIVGIGVTSTLAVMFLLGLITFYILKKRKKPNPSNPQKQPESPFPPKKPSHQDPKFPGRYHSPYFHHPSPRHYNQYHELRHAPAYYTVYPDAPTSSRPYPEYMGTPGFGGHFAPGYVPFSHPRTPPVPEVHLQRVNRKHSITAMADYFTRGRPQVAELSGSN